jgi:hypothetical protein
VSPSATIPGLKIEVNTAKNGITISGTPTAATTSPVNVRIDGKVGGVDASPVTLTITISSPVVTKPVIDSVKVDGLNLTVEKATNQTITLTTTPKADKINITSLTGAGTAVSSLKRTWNGLTVEAKGETITFTETPKVSAADFSAAAIAASGTFGVTADVTIGTEVTEVEKTFTVTIDDGVTAAPKLTLSPLSASPKAGQEFSGEITVTSTTTGTVVLTALEGDGTALL